MSSPEIERGVLDRHGANRDLTTIDLFHLAGGDGEDHVVDGTGGRVEVGMDTEAEGTGARADIPGLVGCA